MYDQFFLMYKNYFDNKVDVCKKIVSIKRRYDLIEKLDLKNLLNTCFKYFLSGSLMFVCIGRRTTQLLKFSVF